MKTAHNYYVNIVECADGLYYTGVTNNLDRRMYEHNQGINSDCFTYKRRPVVLKYYEYYNHINNAIEREKQLKGWSRRKKEALFREDYEALVKFSKRKEDSGETGSS